MTSRDEQVKELQRRIESLRHELQEFMYVEEVLVAARLVSEEKINQAHELVQTLKFVEGK